MKKLIILRHAKSSWKDPLETDFNRKLSGKGKKQIPFIGEKLNELKITPDIFITSPAVRAKKTANKVSDIIGFERARIVNDIRVYEGEMTTLLKILSEIGDGFETIILCGHNPSVSELVTYVTMEKNIDVPTGAFYEIELDILTWKESIANRGTIKNTFIPPEILPTE